MENVINDLFRWIGWSLFQFIFDLVDVILQISNKINQFDLVNSIKSQGSFVSMYNAIFIISISVFFCVIAWRVIQKMMADDETYSTSTLITEIFKCGGLIMTTTLLFTTISIFSIQLASFTGNMFKENDDVSTSNMFMSMYIKVDDKYLATENHDTKYDDVATLLENGTFENEKYYNEKYNSNGAIIFKDKKYIYDINFIVGIIAGGFFLYALAFSVIMLTRKQFEFLILFTISPVIFATSVCNKQRRGALVEQLVSLTLQAAVVMLCISLMIVGLAQIQETTFFDDYLMNVVTKTVFLLGGATILLTGSQMINRFIGANVSANSGRENMMSLMGFGRVGAGLSGRSGGVVAGAGLISGGAMLKGGSTTINAGSNAVASIKDSILQKGTSPKKTTDSIATAVNTVSSVSQMANPSPLNDHINNMQSSPFNNRGGNMTKPNKSSAMMRTGKSMVLNAVLPPTRNIGRRRW